MALDDAARQHIARCNVLMGRAAELKAEMRVVHSELSAARAELQRLDAFDECLSLAFKERTGREAQPAEECTAEDWARARQILGLYDQGT